MRAILARFAIWFLNIVSRYDAAQTWFTDRSRLPGSLQDAKFDCTKAARQEIARKARYFEKNNGVANRLATVFTDYTVGPSGLILIPNSSDKDWNTAAKEYWNNTQQFIDLNSRQHLGILQGLMSWCWFFDGEIFVLKTSGTSNSGRRFPRIQVIESHLCGTPPDLAAEEGKTICDGVKIDSNGRPIGYYFRQSSDSEQYTLRNASDVIHIFEPSRPGQYRGISMLHAAINYLHRLDDLEVLEFRAAGTQAEAAAFFTNAAGQADPSKLRAARLAVGSAVDSSGNASTQQQVEYFREHFGGRAFWGKTGDTMQYMTPTRPSEATRALWSYLTSCTCAAVGISKTLCFSEWLDKAQGTLIRGDYDITAQFFRARSAVMAAALREIYIYVIGWGIRQDIKLADPPADWTNVTVRPPRAPNVDVGRNSAAMLAELAAGATNYDLIYGPLGLDAEEELRKAGKFAKLIREIAKENGVTPGEISKFAADALATAPAPETEDEEETVDA